MAAASSSKTAVDTAETPQENCVWLELKLLQSIVVQSRLGQTILKLVDKFLWVVEKCAEWSLPRLEVSGGENRKDAAKPELVRPLPWLLFLPSLVLLRAIRVTVNMGAFILGYPKITPSRMVKFVQIGRRHLNAAKNKETKIKDRRPINEAKRALIRSMRLTLSCLSCLDASKPSLSPPPTKIHVSIILDPNLVTTISEEKSATESMDSKLKDSANESEEEDNLKETLNEKIDRFALENSEDDEDFDPSKSSNGASSDDDDDDDDDENSDKNSDENSDEDEDEDDEISDEDIVSPAEVHDITQDLPFAEYRSMKNDIERFLHAEQTSALTPPQEPVEPVSGKRSLIKESRDKVEERLATSQRIDSPECYTPDRSSQEGDPTFYSPISSDSDAPKEASPVPITEKCAPKETVKKNEFINGEVRFIPASTISDSKSPRVTNNGAVVQKRSTNVSKCHKGKRTSHGNRKKK